MEGVISYHTHLDNLRHAAERLAETGRSLSVSFDSVNEMLRRKDEASSLLALCDDVMHHFKQVKSHEESGSFGQSDVLHIVSLSGLAMGIASRALNSKVLSTLSNAAGTVSEKKSPFGNVMVRIGPGGLSEDVSVISISSLARQSNQAEDQVMKKLRQNGNLLLNEKAFPALIDRLIKEVLDGRLHLPVSKEKLSEIVLSNNRPPVSNRIKIAYTISPVGPGDASLQNDRKPRLSPK